MGPKHPTITVFNENDCGTAGCDFTVYADMDGCMRIISYGFREALEMGDDWPILVSRWHSDAGTHSLSYHQMIDDRYQVVDSNVMTNILTTLPSADTQWELEFEQHSCHLPHVKEVPTLLSK